MKRITLWVDCQEKDVESVKEKLEAILRLLEVRYTILRVHPEVVVGNTH